MRRVEDGRALRRVQGAALVLLVVGGTVSYVDRGALSVAAPLIRRDLHLGVAQTGVLLSAFLWAYAACQLPAGALIDRFGPRRMLAGGMALWSVAQAVCGSVGTVGQFMAARALLGVGESPQSPSSSRVVRDWFEPHRRGIATGVWNCSSTLGSAVSVPVVTLLMLVLGWRAMFAVLGIVGLAVAGTIWLVYRDPREVELSGTVAAGIRADEERAPVSWAGWRHLWGFRTSWGMVGGFFGTIYALWIYGAWLPSYLEMDRHMSVGRTGVLAAVPFVFGVAGSVSGGWIVDRLARRGWGAIAARKWPMVGALVGAAVCTLMAAEVDSNALCLGFASAAMFAIYVATTAGWALPPVAAPPNSTASLGAILNCGGYVGGALAPMLTGFIVARTGSFGVAFAVGAGVALASALACALLIGEAVPPAVAPSPAPARAEAAGLSSGKSGG